MPPVKKLIKKRRPQKSTIKTTKQGTVTRRNMQRIIKRQSIRKGFAVCSHDKVLRDYKAKDHYLETNATQVARRFSKNELMASIMHIPLAPKQKRLIEKLITSRELKIPGTNISSNRPNSLIFLELVNGLGEKKTRLILERLTKRAKAIQRLSTKDIRNGRYRSDAFINIAPTIGMLVFEFDSEIKNPNEFVKRINSFIDQRRGDIVLLEQSSVLNKEFYIKKLRQQQRDAIQQRVNFQMKNDLAL